jgi:hypothetical protein
VDFSTPAGGGSLWSQTGFLGAGSTCSELCFNLSEINPVVNRNPEVTLHFHLHAGMSVMLAVDHITLTGYAQRDASAEITLEELIDNGDGTYAFRALDNDRIQTAADLVCTWGDPARDIFAATSVWFRQ